MICTAIDARPCFFLQVSGERASLLQCLDRLSRVYPDVRVIIRCDGDRFEADFLNRLNSHANLEVYQEPKLQGAESGGQASHRMLELFLSGPGSVLIKIDSDTQIRKPFTFLPRESSLYYGGTVQGVGAHRSVQGGCIMMSRGFCQRVVQSQSLLSPQFGPPEHLWAQGIPPCRHRVRILGLSSHDWTLGRAAEILGIPAQDHREVLSRWKCFRARDIFRFAGAAAAHPTRNSLTSPWWEPWRPSNLLARVRELAGLDDVQSDFARAKPQKTLDTTDFERGDLPPQVMRWLCGALDFEPRPVFLMGSERTHRELSKFFAVRSFDGLEDAQTGPDSAQALILGRGAWSLPRVPAPVVVIDGLPTVARIKSCLTLLRRLPHFQLHLWRGGACVVFSSEGQFGAVAIFKSIFRSVGTVLRSCWNP